MDYLNVPQVIKTAVPFEDNRGMFCEIFNVERWKSNGIRFVTDSYSVSRRNVFRGFHYQTENPQGKLLTVLRGCIWDVCIDVRDGLKSFGTSWYFSLRAFSSHDGFLMQLWIPPGFAHGYLVIASNTIVTYKATQYRDAESEVVIDCNDPAIKVGLSEGLEFTRSKKDKNGILLADAPRVKV
jgi:dTDP-4-dehydrorhamnose 3,5-epimerase